jgi:hypothetical protein
MDKSVTRSQSVARFSLLQPGPTDPVFIVTGTTEAGRAVSTVLSVNALVSTVTVLSPSFTRSDRVVSVTAVESVIAVLAKKLLFG